MTTNNKDARYLELAAKGKDIPVAELCKLSPDEYVVANWGTDGIAIVKLINAKYDGNEYHTIDTFLDDCTACGGNWAGMFLSGILKKFPDIYALIPDNMGPFAMSVIADLLKLLNIYDKEA